MSAMRERPILFSGPMVRAILEGRKTQTRRVVKFRDVPDEHDCHVVWKAWNGKSHDWQDGDEVIPCPYGGPGDRLWVRETWANTRGDDSMPTYYRADERLEDVQRPWKPSIHMPRWASRITLELTEVRVERVQDISGMDAKREGVSIPAHLPHDGADLDHARRQFAHVWDSLNGPAARRGYGWDVNPWVWVVEFRRVEAS